ncbi:hypothetical protein NBT05_03745 [Aquimarina sp. ERC-38]|uniref:Rieske (2Fe-2S) protein n=1 Tax=Aquimarina sp. ERC-38 TaxID=2949996 RepID=UPI0022451B4E|nr:hypothetical protein [Aquimarina sp. ERC-38]UZO81594.1 hypothetical protein NBT05_03745 [Aquimarina sp. ERC-38]
MYQSLFNFFRNYRIHFTLGAALLFTVVGMVSCADDDRVENPFLSDVQVNFTANLNLPQFSQLKFDNNTVEVSTDGIGIRGLIIHRVTENLFLAYERSDPNHSPNECSALMIEGNEVTCPCDSDDNRYNLITGQPVSGGGQYGLKPYRIEKTGNTLVISN